MSDNLKKLSNEGVSIWLDDISRERLRTGNLADLIRDKQVVGVTSNPTIFAKALSKGSAYDEQVRDLAIRGVDVEEAARSITTYDIRWAADVLRPVYDRTDGVDGRVSIEVDPRLANDTGKTSAEAKALWWMVDRPNLFIKIPATLAGLPAITATLAEGISVNVTLIFSLERYGQVIDAFFEGLEKARANGHDVSKIDSVASFFVSRVDTEIDKRLDTLAAGKGGAERDRILALRGKAAIANAKLAYALFREEFSSPRFAELRKHGAGVQRPLWASTGVKNPAYRDTVYVEDLIGADTVNTMPPALIDAFADHGEVRRTVDQDLDGARRVLADLASVGIDLKDVTDKLLRDGLASFQKSFETLTAGLEKKVATLGREMAPTR
jgi:transaldolase